MLIFHTAQHHQAPKEDLSRDLLLHMSQVTFEKHILQKVHEEDEYVDMDGNDSLHGNMSNKVLHVLSSSHKDLQVGFDTAKGHNIPTSVINEMYIASARA